MLQKLIAFFIHINPKTKRQFWKCWYNTFAKRTQGFDFKFMNYGYHAEGFNPPLEESDDRCPVGEFLSRFKAFCGC